ncbi:hypothetical protein [Celeribacter litoreus]|uniref:hypothetical protein n=1 Tax=Celeribacter litoreus TaxID=2876714 RepID=UPI001CCF47CF|nr:hypothetical protein [Celeribacter litoreus]
MHIYPKKTKVKTDPHLKSMGEGMTNIRAGDKERRALEHQLNFHLNRRISL